MYSQFDHKNYIVIFLKYALALSFAFVFIYPFYNVLIISLNDSVDLTRGYPTWFPRVFSFANYQAVFSSAVLLRAVFLSVSRTVLGTALGLMCNGMLAYALTRNGLPGKRAINQFLIITMYFGGGLITTYILISNIGLINNFLVFILPAAISVYYMIIIKSYFNGLPDSIEEAAKIDGCSDFGTYIRIILPISIPVFAAIGVYYAVNHWNSWWDNYIYANSQHLITLQLLLVRVVKDADTIATLASKGGGSVIADPTQANPMGVRMATTMIATVPILVVYPFFQRYFISGITIGAVKG